jgi:hypothetical protein
MRKLTNKSNVRFREIRDAPRAQSLGKLINWLDGDFFHSFAFYLSRKQAFLRDVNRDNKPNDLAHSAKLQVTRLLYELRNRKHIPKTSPTHYVESGCAWAATTRT